MVKPVAGEIVVVPFPRTDSGKRRPAFVIADLPGADLILCQITSRAQFDGFAVTLDNSDCERGQIDQPCHIRPQRLFSLEHHLILHSLGKVTEAKLEEVFFRCAESRFDYAAVAAFSYGHDGLGRDAARHGDGSSPAYSWIFFALAK